MDGWKQLFVLLLPVCACVDSRVSVVKTVGRDPDITPVCTSAKLGVIILVKCMINTETHRGDECCLLYTGDKQSDYKCDSRFMLLSKNYSIFILLNNLTPTDSGNYTCECSYKRGTHVVHLNITVEGGEEGTFSGMRFIASLVIAIIILAMFIIMAGIICDQTQRGNHHRENTRSGASALTRSETPFSLDQDDLYASLQLPASDVYHTISSSCRYHDTEAGPANSFNNQETDGKEKDLHPDYTVYETIEN
ncbi:uncharacterized protein LOC111236720 isoform X2 [Seriola dumerili]|uniref:uncharacterized protein LOC111236720 isoform X2 n=1 Tax=Seriola dumerili TaxID=41447 RepID=UPI000BBEB495|nr:uncharacterized protein LOC111236720 isoform X2 [Seriola dumerili]